MDIESIGEILKEGKIQGKEKSALEFLLETISDFPVYDLKSADEYIVVVKPILGKPNLYVQDLINYLNSSPTSDENTIWYKASITSLVHSMEVMNTCLTVDDFVTDLKARTRDKAA